MRISTIAILGTFASILSFQPALAADCYDLWYERNQIYDDYGFCFKTRDGRETFDNSDCYTSSPRFSRADQRRIDQIKRQERRMGCE
jgi:YARHG domain